MRWLGLTILAVSGLLLNHADGADCRRIVNVARNHHVVAVDRVLIADYVQVPAYWVGHAPGVSEDKFRKLESDFIQLKAELDRQRGIVPPRQPGESVPPPQYKDQQTETPTSTKTCASCHDARNGAKNGGGNVFFDGGYLIASDRQRLRMVESILDGTMPKGLNLKDEDAGQAVSELVKFRTKKSV